MLVAGLPYPMGPSAPTPIYAGTFRIASGSVTSDLTDFPVRVDLARMPTGFWAGTNNGEDLRFFSGASELPTDLVYCDTVNGKGEIWVLVPLVDADANTDITWTTDGTSSRPAVGAANGMNAVWADYEYVGIPYTDFGDRTGNNSLIAASGTRTFGEPSGGNSQYAGGGQADVFGSRTRYSCTDPSGVFTISSSFLTANNTQDTYASLNTTGGGSNRVDMVVDDGDNVGLWDNNNVWLYTGFNPDNTNWNRGTAKYNGSTQRKVICNATNIGTDNTVSAKTGYSEFWIGDANAPSEAFEGKIGWTYLRAEYLSDDWIVAEHNMMADNTFCDAV